MSVAACRPHRSPRPAGQSADLAELDAAIDGEHALLARYDRAIAQLDAVAAASLVRARGRHGDHLRALSAAMRPMPSSPPSSATPSLGAMDGAAVETLLSASAAQLRSTAVRLRSGRLAALVASVAAEHEAEAFVAGDPR